VGKWEREAAKPCSVCEGIKMTWGNVNQFTICDKHRGELIRSIKPIAPEAAPNG